MGLFFRYFLDETPPDLDNGYYCIIPGLNFAHLLHYDVI
jgi:hypothetical protein